ncbi:MAG: hypothetical protein LBR15_09880 [Methanobrevibacter sp.]|jgi:hypothetical protein|nr:hypothetical protein [Candidatus Methanovirga australis]
MKIGEIIDKIKELSMIKKKYLILIVIILLIIICSVYGYCDYKYKDNIKEIDNLTYTIKNNVYNYTNNSTDLENESFLDTVEKANESWTNASMKIKSVKKLINETRSYTFFDNKKINHLNKCSEIIDSFELYTETKIDACNTSYNIVKTQGLLGLLGFDLKHYDKIFNETQDKINKTSI